MIYARLALAVLVTIAALTPAPHLLAASGENAIARLNYAGYSRRGHCTAVLISDKTVLTARHCTDQWPRPALRLVFGYARGEWVEVRKVAAIHRHEEQDLAVLCLDEPSAQKPIDVEQRDGRLPVQEATIIGYPRSRAHLPRTKTCSLAQGRKRARFECPLEPGMSGSPVFANIEDERRIIGIASRTSKTASLIERTVDLPQAQCQ